MISDGALSQDEIEALLKGSDEAFELKQHPMEMWINNFLTRRLKL